MKGSRWYRGFMVTAAVLAVLIGAVSGLPENTAEEEASMITDFHMGTVAGAALVNEKGAVALMIQDGEIEVLQAPADWVFSAANRKAFLYRMAHIPVKENLGEVKDWKQYGLEEPRARVTLFLTDGSKTVVYLGDETSLEDGWYLRREGDESLYVADEVTARMMEYSINDFREQDVLPAIGPDSLEELVRFRLTQGSQVLEIRGEKKEGEVCFYLTLPFEAALGWQTVAEKILTPLSRVETVEFLGEYLSEEEYGFDGEEQWQLTLELAGEEREISFVPGEGNTFYCKNANNGQVILADGEEINALFNQSAASLIGSTLYPVNAADVEQIQIDGEGLREEMELWGQGELLRGYWDGRELNQEETLRLFQILIMIPPAEPLKESMSFSDEPLLTLYFRKRNGTEDILELIPVSQRRCAVQINGAASFTTYTATIEEIIRTVKAMT